MDKRLTLGTKNFVRVSLPVPLSILLVGLDVDVTLVFAQHLDTTKRSFQVFEDQSQNVTFGGFFNFSLALTWQHKNTKKSARVTAPSHT